MSVWQFNAVFDEMVERMSLATGRDKDDVIRFAFALYSYLQADVFKGKRIAVLDHNGNVEKIVKFPNEK